MNVSTHRFVFATFSWMDCQYLNEANDALHNCRYALKYTYVYAYYLSRDCNHFDNFEMQQTMLEQQTEQVREWTALAFLFAALYALPAQRGPRAYCFAAC